MKIKDRIKELRRVKASELMPNPKNWRKHPQSQQDALRGVLSEIGYAAAVLARETPDGGLMLIDGHLRAEMTPDAEVPVLVLDVDEAEADKLLATFDPIGAMADTDQDILNSVIDSFEANDADFRNLLDSLVKDSAKIETEKAVEDSIGMSLRPHEHYDYLVVLARDSSTWNVLCERLGIARTSLGGRRKSRLGICRALTAEKLLERLQNNHSKPEPSEAGDKVSEVIPKGDSDC